MRISPGEDAASDPNRANGKGGPFRRAASAGSTARNQEGEPSLGLEFAEGERCARQKDRSLEETGVMASLDPAILAPKGVGPEIGNSAFREWVVDLSSRGVRARPRRRCFLVWGPLPAPRTRTPRPARTQSRGSRNLRPLSGPGR